MSSKYAQTYFNCVILKLILYQINYYGKEK